MEPFPANRVSKTRSANQEARALKEPLHAQTLPGRSLNFRPHLRSRVRADYANPFDFQRAEREDGSGGQRCFGAGPTSSSCRTRMC